MAYSRELLDEMSKAQDVFVWEAPSWESYERSPRWYTWMTLIAVALTIYAVVTANYLFAFIILLTSIILILTGNERPQTVLIQIGNNGIVYDGLFYQFSDLSDFSLVYQPPELKILYIQPKNPARGRLRISLEQEDPIAIRSHLKKYLEEDVDLRNEHLSDTLARLLKI